jgi:hypothetical protein
MKAHELNLRRVPADTDSDCLALGFHRLCLSVAFVILLNQAEIKPRCIVWGAAMQIILVSTFASLWI